MKSYEQALNEIYSKADERLLQINKRRKRTRIILLTFAPICLVLIITLSVGIGLGIGSTSPHVDNDTPNNGVNTDNPSDSGAQGGSAASEDSVLPVVNGAEPSIYPAAWRKMNAVIVKWGELNSQTWSEAYSPYAGGEGEGYTVKYVGVDVEFLKVYSDTMRESLAPDVEKAIGQTTYLLIPEYCLDEIKAGDTALVFLDVIANVITQSPDGASSTAAILLGVRSGDLLAPGQFAAAPIFAVSNGKVSVTDDAYKKDPQNDEYYMEVMNYLRDANECIEKDGTVKTVIFENGADIEELAELFSYVCGQ